VLRELLRPARHEFEQQVMQAADGLGAGAAEQFPAVDEQAQRHGVVVHGDLTQIVGAPGDHGDAVRVDRVGCSRQPFGSAGWLETMTG
jgi:hypothetical protein